MRQTTSREEIFPSIMPMILPRETTRNRTIILQSILPALIGHGGNHPATHRSNNPIGVCIWHCHTPNVSRQSIMPPLFLVRFNPWLPVSSHRQVWIMPVSSLNVWPFSSRSVLLWRVCLPLNAHRPTASVHESSFYTECGIHSRVVVTKFRPCRPSSIFVANIAATYCGVALVYMKGIGETVQ